MKNQKKTKTILQQMRKMTVFMMTACMILSLTACGSGKDQAESTAASSGASGAESASSEGLSEYIYAASFQSLGENKDGSYTGDAWLDGEELFLTNGTYSDTLSDMEFAIYDAASMQKKMSLKASDLFADFLAGAQKGAFSSLNFSSMCVREDRIYLVASASVMDEEYQQMEESCLILALDRSGAEVLRFVLDDSIRKEGEYFYINGIAADPQGRILLICDSRLILLDSDGKLLGEINGEQGTYYQQAFALGEDLYVAYQDMNTNWEYVAQKVDMDGAALGDKLQGFPQNTSRMFPDPEGSSLLVATSQSLYRYTPADQKTEQILSWTDSNILGDQVRCLSLAENGDFRAVLFDWNTSGSELATLKKTPRSEVKEVTDLVISSLYPDQQLSSAVIAFSKSQTEYRVNINVAYDWEKNPDMDFNDAMTNLQNSLTGQNPPDLVTMEEFADMEGMVKKGVFEDLTPYAQSAGLDLSGYIKGVIESATYDGKLICIPKSFSILTLAGSAKELGTDKAGWTIDQMIDFAEAHPGKQLIDYQDRDSMMQVFFAFTMDSFVDWEKGECHFNGPEFQRILTFLSKVNSEMNWDDERSTPVMVSDGDVMLAQAYIMDASEIQLYDAIFEGGCNLIGYPTMDGHAAASLRAEGGVAMLSGSSHKEGAWKFLEFYNSMDSLYSWGLSPDRSKVEAEIDKAIREKSHEGNGMSYGDWNYTYHAVTRQEGDRFLELLDTAKAPQATNQTIYDIINEEAAGFFEGQKSVEDVMETIQSRVSLYLMENR